MSHRTDLSCSHADFWYIFLSRLSSSTTPSSSTSVLDPFGLMTLILSTACFFFKSLKTKTKQLNCVLNFYLYRTASPSLTSATKAAVTLVLYLLQVAEACTVWLHLELSSEMSPPMDGVHSVCKEAEAFKLRLPTMPHAPACISDRGGGDVHSLCLMSVLFHRDLKLKKTVHLNVT